jgi:quercetin dioxygenase-like cupin family protein
LLSAGGRLSGQAQTPAQTPGPDDDFRFRPDHERSTLKGKTMYQKFKEEEGLPTYTGHAVNVYKIELKPWKRLGPGVTGAFIDLEGAGFIVNTVVTGIAPGAQTKAERHLTEEQLIVMKGEGEAHIWQSDPAKKVVIPFRRGTVLSPPLNTWHEFINKGKDPVLLAAVTDLPLKIDLFRNRDFIFNDTYNFTDRYNGQPDYFDPERSIDFSPKLNHSLSIVNLIRDAWTWRLFYAGQGYGDIDRHFVMSDNNMPGHVEAWPVGAYQRAHAHGPGATLIHLGGSGYSLMWPRSLGETPWKDGKGDQVTRVDWEEGTVLIPPIMWYHQHFATGPSKNAKFIMLGGVPENEKYSITTRVITGNPEGHLILFKDEDPYVRKLFDEEMAKVGSKVSMPDMRTLIAVEEKCGPEDLVGARPDCRIPAAQGSQVKDR